MGQLHANFTTNQHPILQYMGVLVMRRQYASLAYSTCLLAPHTLKVHMLYTKGTHVVQDFTSCQCNSTPTLQLLSMVTVS